MATPWPIRRERCSRGSACLARWSASSFMLLWLPWMLLWLPWPTRAEQVGGGGHGGKALHGSLSSSSSSSSSSSFSSFPSSSSALGFNTRQNGGQLDWLLSEKGPFHRCPEYTEFRERFQQGFSTRYKIYRWERSWTSHSLWLVTSYKKGRNLSSHCAHPWAVRVFSIWITKRKKHKTHNNWTVIQQDAIR